jgi:hypothetical protein
MLKALDARQQRAAEAQRLAVVAAKILASAVAGRITAVQASKLKIILNQARARVA